MKKIKWFFIRLLLTKHDRFLMAEALSESASRKITAMSDTLAEDARICASISAELYVENYENNYSASFAICNPGRRPFVVNFIFGKK